MALIISWCGVSRPRAFSQGKALVHTKAVLLIDDDEAQPVKRHLFRNNACVPMASAALPAAMAER